MAAPIPIDRSELEFDYGTFDAQVFAGQALADPENLASVIDCSLLRSDATRSQVEELCRSALRHGFASVLVPPVWAAAAVNLVAGSEISVCVLVGSPLGTSLVSALREEAAALLRMGVRELEMVVPMGQLKSGDRQAVRHAIGSVVHLAHERDAIIQVSLETAVLNTQEKLAAAEIAIDAGVDGLKSSCSSNGALASPTDIALLRGIAGARCGICASGGIRTLADVKAMLEAGASRIATAAGSSILQELTAA